MVKEVWEMTKSEWLSQQREFELTPREMTLEEYRSMNNYPNPLEDHGDLRYPNGMSKSDRSRIQRRLEKRLRLMRKGEVEYLRKRARGELPTVTIVREIRSDGLDLDSSLAAARVFHKRQVFKAFRRGEIIREEVLKDYPNLKKEK